jgi:hypothetical protein
MKILPKKSPQAQRGIATIIVVLMVGFTLLVATMGLFSLVRSTQDQAAANHASIQSQPKVWNATELVRQFIFTLNTNGTLIAQIFNASTTAVPITQTGTTGLTMSVVGCQNTDGSGNCTNTSDSYYATVNITALTDPGTKAASTSTVEVIYLVTEAINSGGGPPVATDDVIVFNDNVTLDSNITLINNTGYPYNINITGDLYAKSNIIGFDVINVEGNVTLESNPEDIKRINANGNIKVDANLNKDTSGCQPNLSGYTIGDDELVEVPTRACSTAMYSRGNICLTSNAYTNNIAKANGFVYSDTSGDGQFTDVVAIGSSDWGGSQICGSNSKAVDISDNSKSITLPNGENYDKSGSTTIIRDDAITPVPLVDIDVGLFNAFDHEGNANYVIKRVSGKTKVTVTDINTILDGEYFLRSGKLCTQDNNSTCINGGNFKLCGNNTSDCFSGSSTFTVKDTGTSTNGMIKQGVIWVDGNLKLEGDGLYYNTFMATGNITVDGNHTVYAVNYAGYDGNGLTYDDDILGLEGNNVRGICPNSGGGSRAPVSTTYYPTNFCDNPDPTDFNDAFGGGIGNFTLTAGSIDPGDSSYDGGDITITSNVSQYGSLIAGNRVYADSNINIHGTLSGESNRSSGTHTLSSNINIYTEPVATYTPGNTINPGVASNGLVTDVAVLWSRYL